MKGTIKELVGTYQVGRRAINPAQMSVLLTFLEEAGQAKRVGKVAKAEGQRGKVADIWEIPDNVQLTFSPRNAAQIAGE